MFQSTLPFGEPDLMRASEFRRWLDEAARDGSESTAARLSTLSPSLMLDLLRFEQQGRHGGAIEILAACIRHARRLLLHLQAGKRIVPLTLFPVERLVHCPMPMTQFLQLPLGELGVLHVEPALLRPPGDRVRSMVGELQHYGPLGAVAWELALRGAREELLPEIAGQAAYRISAGLNLRTLQLRGSLAAAVARLQRETTSLRQIAQWPGFDRGRATRLLNGLYLQGGLIVSRTHPAASEHRGGSRAQ
ncbi:MAG TPA: hypothetical protein PKB14_02215 [Rubrivivax sp.]|nr:hypothetical protein [Rubrivivax sp.]